MSAGPKWIVVSRPTGPHRTTFMLCDAWEGTQVATFDVWELAEAAAAVLNGADAVFVAEVANAKQRSPF